MRDRVVDTTVRLRFTTNDGDGAPVAPSSAFAASDFRIYKDGSATQKTSINGITVTSPFDSVVGRHLIEIDTSNDTDDAGFWALNSEYSVEVNSAKTVDGVSQSGVIVGEFRLVSGTVELDSAARVKLDASQPDYAPATVAAVAAAKAILDKIDTGLVQDGLVYQFTANMLELAPAATGVDELITLQNQILDAVNTYISNVTAAAILTPGTIVGFPETLTVGDSYTDDCDSAIQVFIRDENDDPITAVGTHDFTDGDFAPECIITQNGNTGRVNCTVTYVTASPENYLKIQIPSKESRRATPGIATVQVLLKWDGAQKALSKQTVTWEALI